MPPVSAETLVQNLNWRYATKKFDPARKIAEGTWRALEQSLVLSPSSFGLQLWKFIVVQDASLRAKLREAAWNQSQVTDASHLVVFCRKTNPSVADIDRFIDSIAQTRGVPRAALDGYHGMMTGFLTKPSPGFDASVWTSRQVYIALGFFLSTAAQLGVDACPMEGFDPGAFDRILDLTGTGFASTVIATAGYRAADDEYASATKVRFAASDIITHR